MINHETLINGEQSVIGSLLRDNDSFDNLIDLTVNDFFREDHRIIFSELILFLEVGKPVDIILLAEELDRKGNLDKVGGLPYLSTLMQSVGTSKNIKYHAKNIKSNSKRRSIKALISELNAAIESRETPEEIAEKAEEELFNLLDNKVSNLSHISHAVSEAIEWADSDEKGINTGIVDLDRMVNGLNRANLIIIAGRPSMGKSALSMQIAEQIAKHDSVIIFSLEMSKREVATRFIKYHETVVGRSEAVKHLFSLKLHIDDTPAVGISYIRSQCRKVKRKHGLELIVIDYIQLMTGKGDNRTQEVGAISRGLKSLSKEFNIPVVVLSQLSRKVEERSDRRPIMSDLRESGEIEQDADVILFIYRDEVYHENSEYFGHAEILCKKNRNGATGEILTTFSGELTRFGNTTRRIERVERKPENRGFS